MIRPSASKLLVFLTALFTASAASAEDDWEREAPDLGGSVIVRYEAELDDEDQPHGFALRRARLSVDGEVTPRVGYEVDLEATTSQTPLRDAYITIALNDDYELRLGQQKLGFGWENTASLMRIAFERRAEVSESIALGASRRDIGAGIVGELDLSPALSLEQHLTLVNGSGANVWEDDNNAKNLWGRLGLRYRYDAWRVHVGISGGYGDAPFERVTLTDPSTRDIWRVGGDLRVRGDAVFFAAELVYGEDTSQAVEADPVTETVGGGLVELGARTPWRVGPALRYDWLDDGYTRWTGGVYYGERSDRWRVIANLELRPESASYNADQRFYLSTRVRF